MMGPFTEGDIVKFEQSIKAFEEKTGIDIQYEGTKEFEATIGVRVDAGDVPDIVDFPQPGLLAAFFKQGNFVDPTPFLPMDYLKQQYTQGWLDMATMAGPDGPGVGGIWARYNGKSQVWYPKDDFEAAGYAIPTTWEELIALSDQIVADGDTPWCVGIESGAATGWPATDWMEEFMLRTTTPENYDKWVSGELKFDSPEVRAALTKLSELWLKEGYVYGGQEAITTTFFGDAPAPMFEQPPMCWLHKQGNFITSFFPEGVKVGEDYDFFYLPGIDPQFGVPTWWQATSTPCGETHLKYRQCTSTSPKASRSRSGWQRAALWHLRAIPAWTGTPTRWRRRSPDWWLEPQQCASTHRI